MDRERFGRPYNRTAKPDYLSAENKNLNDVVQPFEAWSTYFGDALHGLMLGRTDTEVRLEDFLSTYSAHIRSQGAANARILIEEAVQLDTEGQDAENSRKILFRALQSHNFHMMSQSMTFSWAEMISEIDLNPEERRQLLSLEQFNIAQSAIGYAKWRAAHSSISHSHEYFTESFQQDRNFVSGILTEFDTAITLIEISKQNPNILVVPAPRRFEDSSKKINADFIVYDRSTDQVVGVQSKTKVSEQDRERYDQDRIVLISGETDLGGTVWTRTEAGKSVTKPVVWPGMIAAEHLKAMKLYGKNGKGFETFDRRELLRLQAEAAQLLRPEYDGRKVISGTIQQAKAKVTSLILPYLNQ